MIVSDQNALSHTRARNQTIACRFLTLALLVFTLVMALPQALVHAADQRPLVLSGPASMEVLGRHLEYNIDAAWQLTAQDFINPATVSTQPLATAVPDFGYTPAKIWLRVPVINGTAAQDDWRFFVHSNFTQEIAIYKFGSDGGVTTLLDLNRGSPFRARPINYPQMVAPFELNPGEAATLVVSYYSQGSSRLSMSLETPESFARIAAVSQAKNYAFYGMMLVMFALVSAALIVLRQPVFAAFSGYILSMLTYVSHSDGVAFQHIWSDYPQFNSIAAILAGSSVLVFGGLFAMAILQTSRFHPIMHRVLIAAVGSVLLVDAVFLTTNPQLLNRLLTIMLSVCTLIYLIAGLNAARTRFKEVRFFVFAWIAVFIPASLFTARHAFGFEPEFITLYDTIRIALVIEALLMGLAIFDRYNQMRQSAMEENLAEVKRSLALSQRLTALEGNYAQVTDNSRRREESVKDTVHDLRQPMHALRLSLRQLLDPQAGKAKDAGQIESALAYMERLVAERLAENPEATMPGMVDTAGKSTNEPAGHPQEASKPAAEPGIHEVLRGIADMFAAEADAKGLKLSLVLAAPDSEVAAYPLMRVVANLVSNAIKYTRKGRILIALRRHGKSHRVEVHDTGPGLAGKAFEQALIRDQRLDRDLAVAEGSGLGLSVVKQIVEANSWKITTCERRRTGASIRVAV
jgi:two-component system, sensor histidine kinase LadS